MVSEKKFKYWKEIAMVIIGLLTWIITKSITAGEFKSDFNKLKHDNLLLLEEVAILKDEVLVYKTRFDDYAEADAIFKKDIKEDTKKIFDLLLETNRNIKLK